MNTDRKMTNNITYIETIDNVSKSLFSGVSNIIDYARQEVVVYVNRQANMMFWHIGKYINEDMGYKRYSAYGSKILATLSQRLTERYGKGFSYSALSRMMKVAQLYREEEKFATLSRTLTWSHFLELVAIEDDIKVAQYLTCLPDKQWFIDKLNRAILIAKEYSKTNLTDVNTEG